MAFADPSSEESSLRARLVHLLVAARRDRARASFALKEKTAGALLSP